MEREVLITGGYGFLGRAIARKLKTNGCHVSGIGNGRWDDYEAKFHGFDQWLDAPVTMSSLATLNVKFDLIVHCAGNGSVGYSLSNPLQDFKKTVEGTAELLEYMRLNNPSARMVYPSSAGVYGTKPDVRIEESAPLNPISPYGYHKKVAEELSESYSRSYGLRISVIRFFSIYGPGLTKQLLWDAAQKLLSSQENAVFWGTGDETRDWIYIDDATDLICRAAQFEEPFAIVNGAGGNRITVRETLEILRTSLGSHKQIIFNNNVKAGDPRYYHADVTSLLRLDWKPKVPLVDGIREYAMWYKGHMHG